MKSEPKSAEPQDQPAEAPQPHASKVAPTLVETEQPAKVQPDVAANAESAPPVPEAAQAVPVEATPHVPPSVVPEAPPAEAQPDVAANAQIETPSAAPEAAPAVDPVPEDGPDASADAAASGPGASPGVALSPEAAIEAEPDDFDDAFDDEEEEEIPIVLALGIMDMDKKLGGGLPLETLTLVEGDPESGKSVVVQQLMFGALKEGLRVSVFLSEKTAREFLDQMDAIGMNCLDYYLIGRLSLYEANLRVDQERAQRLTTKLIKFVETSEDSDVFIVDSITPLLFQFDARYVLSFLATCRDVAATGRSILVTLHSYAINESLRLRASSIVDAHLRLSIEELGSQVVRTLEVLKIRGAVKTIGNTVSFNVEPGLGLKSVPIQKTKG